MSAEREVKRRFGWLRGLMDERMTRLWAGAEALALGHGGREVVARATGLSRTTVLKGKQEARGKKPPKDLVRVRRKGAGPKPIEEVQPGVREALEALVEPVSRGDPESPLRWTCKSTRELAQALKTQGYTVGRQKVSELLAELGYSLQGTKKMLEGESHPDRDAQFRHINAAVEVFTAKGQPVVSVDTKKKELVGAFSNGGREWQPKGVPVYTHTHDFPQDAIGKAIPYGVYDVAANIGWVSVGQDHDTPVFAVNALRAWWRGMGQKQYPLASQLLVTADAGGSNGYRSRLWKSELQKFATETGLEVNVSHFPPGTSKWNKVEHCLFSHISRNWRGRPLEDYETVVRCIGATRTAAGLRVKARLDKRRYRTGLKVPDAVLKTLHLSRATFHGEWNYALRPQLIT